MTITSLVECIQSEAFTCRQVEPYYRFHYLNDSHVQRINDENKTLYKPVSKVIAAAGDEAGHVKLVLRDDSCKRAVDGLIYPRDQI
ncbi:hypothetical protein RRG08_022199 [Elysia crispata]|uniref:Uncharacterized protein n=1 Tax=Elysia crispata TaxID=231223 RepID=A0AAE0YXE0_9GAST|nr:hypothetical protein RRG08_022199 [Elysia crispata]